MAINARTIFLLDGIGAFGSVVLLGVILPAVQPWLGMPLYILHRLALWATGCMVYSLGCYRFADHSTPHWLIGTMTLNTVYCVITASLLAVHHPSLTSLGIAYFIAEMPVIVGLVWFEFRVYRRTFSS